MTELPGEKLRYRTGNKEDDARVDVSARNFWRFGDKIFLDIRISNPIADTHTKKSLKEAYVIGDNNKIFQVARFFQPSSFRWNFSEFRGKFSKTAPSAPFSKDFMPKFQLAF